MHVPNLQDADILSQNTRREFGFGDLTQNIKWKDLDRSDDANSSGFLPFWLDLLKCGTIDRGKETGRVCGELSAFQMVPPHWPER